MRHVFSSARDVAHAWASGTIDHGRARAGKMYFDSDGIYSYGRHFCIACRVGDKILFTTRTYSATTAIHLSCVRSAICHLRSSIIYVPVPSPRFDLDNVTGMLTEARKLLKRAAFARERRPHYVAEIQAIINNLVKYCALYKVKFSPVQKCDVAEICATLRDLPGYIHKLSK